MARGGVVEVLVEWVRISLWIMKSYGNGWWQRWHNTLNILHTTA